MAKLNYGMNLPTPPKKMEEIQGWAKSLHRTLADTNQNIAEQLNSIILMGEEALMPEADGSGRFFWATDTKKLYVDDGTWNPV